VSADVRNGEAITDEPVPEIYIVARPGRWPLDSRSEQGGVLSLRTTAPLVDAAAFLRQIAADLDPRQLVTLQTGEELLTTLTAQPRFVAWLLTAFATLALLLAAAGLYSVASYLVTQRRREIAVRVAVGATPRDVAGHVVGEAGRWIVAGAVFGCALAWIGTRALKTQLYGVQTLDAWSWAAALLPLALALLAVVLRPAYLASRVDPIAALRAE
jgi:predicted lysophospholipase L1 biosynthesis ABC-type transport system permease subunit